MNEQLVTATLKQFTAAIDREVAERLAGDDVLRERLARVRRASDELVSYGYDSVTLWMRLVLASDRGPVGLAERDLVEVAKETVASALNALGNGLDGNEQKVALLARCADRLPVLVGEGIIAGLRFCMADVRLATHLMRKWARADIDVIDLVANTRRVLRRSGATS